MNTRNRNRIWRAGTAVALSLALAPGLWCQAADLQSTVPADHPIDAAPSTVTKVNKASSLLGMDVRNNLGEKLGDIKDLVLDLHSGKIEYAVLSVGGFLGIGDKYIAVPAGAFTEGPDHDRLVLNADKAKIQSAPSFAKTSWPDVNSPSWATEAAYWQPENTAQGTLGTIHSGTGSESVPSITKTERDVFRGEVTAIDPVGRIMIVKGPADSREFKIAEKATITLKDSRNPSLVDVKVGYPVSVGYHDANGTYIADSVTRTDTPEVK